MPNPERLVDPTEPLWAPFEDLFEKQVVEIIPLTQVRAGGGMNLCIDTF